jgi:hypothetical protein
MDDPYAFITKRDELTHHDFYYIQRKLEQNWITERDIELIKFIHVHRWLTLSQISRLFFPEVDRDRSVRTRVNRLMKFGLLRRIKWSSYSQPTENKPSFYELGNSGADILKYQYGMSLGQREPRLQKPQTMLFRMKHIATNELYIQLRESFNLVHFEFHPSLKNKEEHVVPIAKYVLRNPKGREMPFYLICHREEEKWVKTVRFQARFFKEYIANVEKEAILVILVSTDEKALLASKIAEQEGAGTFTWYVTDKDLHDYNISLKNGFFFYQNGEKLYYDLR